MSEKVKIYEFPGIGKVRLFYREEDNSKYNVSIYYDGRRWGLNCANLEVAKIFMAGHLGRYVKKKIQNLEGELEKLKKFPEIRTLKDLQKYQTPNVNSERKN